MDEGTAFVWLGTTLKPRVLDGLHTFRIETLEEGRVKFRQEEKLNGLLLYIVVPFIKSTMQSNFSKMNTALKEYIENLPVQTNPGS